MNKTALIIITIALVVVIGIIFTGSKNDVVQDIEIKDGVQYIRIKAGGGYSPRTTEARADIPTKLIMQTSGVFDCSAALVIPSIGFQKVLPQSGETEINIGSHKEGEVFKGLCSMGMYSFEIKFQNLN